MRHCILIASKASILSLISENLSSKQRLFTCKRDASGTRPKGTPLQNQKTFKKVPLARTIDHTFELNLRLI